MSVFENAYRNIKTKYPELAGLMNSEKRAELGAAFSEIITGTGADSLLMKDIVDVIGDLECIEALDALIRLAKSDKTPGNVKRACVNCLKKFECENSVNAFISLLGISTTENDKWIRQLATQNLSSMIRRIQRTDEASAEKFLDSIRKNSINSNNTFTRMNAAIVLRNVQDEKALPYLEERLAVEKESVRANKSTVGTPFVIKELELSIAKLSN